MLAPESLEKIIRRIKRIIKKHKIKFDTIGFTGMSGSLVAPILAVRLKKKMLFVRKNPNFSHGEKIEGYLGGRVLVIDDFIETGKTIKRILNALEEVHTECSAIILYNTECSSREYKLPKKFRHIPIYS